MIEHFLRANPFLKPVHIYDLYDRMLEASDGTMMVLYNMSRDTYEIHSLKSFQYNKESLNVVLEDDMLNGWIITDYLSNNINRFGLEVKSDRDLTNQVLEQNENKGFDLLQKKTLKTIETVIGREI